MKQTAIGIVGCGNIAQAYLNNLSNLFKNTKVVAVCDINMERAQQMATEYNVPKVLSFEEMLQDDEVEIVLNLTIPQQHYPLSKRALEAGKNVYSEKPLAVNYEQASELVALAKQKGVLLGCAPDTFMGSAFQTARKAIDDGLIGTVISAETFDVNHGHENWHPSPEFFYQQGGGPDYDRAPYNFTTLISLMGKAKRVVGITSKAFEQRTITSEPKYGQTFDVEVPTHISGLVEFENGAVCTSVFSFDVWGNQLPNTEIHGTLGTLILPSTIRFGGEVLYKSYFSKEFVSLPMTHIYDANCRGLGLADMANALEDGHTPLANGEMACHVVEILDALHSSYQDKKFYEMQSDCPRPGSLPVGLVSGYVK